MTGKLDLGVTLTAFYIFLYFACVLGGVIPHIAVRADQNVLS